jgi:hypothetical protein
VSTCAVLFVFKYFDFFNDTIALAGARDGDGVRRSRAAAAAPRRALVPHVPEPELRDRGVHGRQRAERDFGLYALYVMFYPQLVAGPIERPQNLLHQLREEHRFDYARVVAGLQLMAWGLVKKIVVADRLAELANRVYDAPQQLTGLPLIIGTVAFAFQIYCDFSGYSDIAIGAAQVMGIDLMKNFDRPVHGAQHRGVLAALAHLVVDLVSRLPLHPARRQPRGAATLVRQPLHHFSRERAVAWSAVDVRGVGSVAWRVPHPRARLGRRAGAGAQRARARATSRSCCASGRRRRRSRSWAWRGCSSAPSRSATRGTC